MALSELPAYVDEHRRTIPAPRERVWKALRGYVDGALTRDRDDLATRLLGTEPRAGFAVTREVPGRELELSGRHRFSRYALVFRLIDAVDGRTELHATTYADFPGVRGQAYKTLVIRSRLHVLAVRHMLRAVARGEGILVP